ncbi:FAD-dependent monooxygenase [Paraburkholderia sp. BCC1884]|uniref:FAD-dependent monooxygenase n=1 Tax=Paraburkholderia sp. BCC1884 TaxID=2562668 RepID=UPI001182DCE2|nr:FAD-dependent monooxygenase [Paraburkholderia sp. BCC1884]
MENDQDTLAVEVAVIGAGPIGLTAANLLAEYGIRTMLVERNPNVADEPRAISITDESLRVMDQIGILDKLEPEMLLDTGTRYFGRKGQLLAEVQPRAPRLGHPGKSNFDQPILAQLLLEAAKSRPLLDLHFHAEASNVVDVGGGVEFTLATPEGQRRVQAKWLIACDGGRSPIRTQLGIPLEGSTQVEKWIVVDVLNTPGVPERISQFHCNGVRPCVVVPGVKGRCRYEFMLLREDDEAQAVTPEFIIKLVQPYQRIQPRDIRRAAVYTAQQRVAQSYRRGRIVLAGDAAHLMPPFAGQGLNAGVRDAANIAWKIAACVKGEAEESLIDTYAIERRPHVSDMVRLSHRIGQIVMSTQPLLTAARDHTIAALSLLPTAKEWVVGMRFLKQPHFTKGCVVPPSPDLPAAVSALVGRSLPQPKVVCGEGPVVGLDKALGIGWALLRFKTGREIEILRGMQSLGERECQTVFDFDDTFAGLSGGDFVLIIRPDRYVAAVARERTLKISVDALARLVPALNKGFFADAGQASVSLDGSMASG